MSIEQRRAASKAAWAVTMGRPTPPPPKGVSEARWLAMIKQTILQIEGVG